MSESSVAPKERVNITYRPATGDAHEEVELPLRVLVLGDLTQRHDTTPVEERTPVQVDKDNFDEVLAAQHLSLDLSVPDRLCGHDDESISVRVALRSLHDFTPEGIAKAVPELRSLLELRDALTALKSPLAERPQFRKRLQSCLHDDAARLALMRELGMGPTHT